MKQREGKSQTPLGTNGLYFNRFFIEFGQINNYTSPPLKSYWGARSKRSAVKYKFYCQQRRRGHLTVSKSYWQYLSMESPNPTAHEEGGKAILYQILLLIKKWWKLKTLIQPNPTVNKGGWKALLHSAANICKTKQYVIVTGASLCACILMNGNLF